MLRGIGLSTKSCKSVAERGRLVALRVRTTCRPTFGWYLSTADRHWLLGASALMLAQAAIVMGLLTWQAGRRAQLAEQTRLGDQRTVVQHAEDLAAEQRAHQMPGRTWQAALGVGLPTDAVLSEAHQSALPAGLSVKRATVATPVEGLASSSVVSTDLTVELAGSYSALKIWLRELLARHPSLAVLTLSLRRAAGDEGVEATVVLRLFGVAR